MNDPAMFPHEGRGEELGDPVNTLVVGADGAPPAAEEAAIRGGPRTASDADHLGVGLPTGVDLAKLEDAPLEDLIEAELVAIDEGDPETSAMILDEIDQRRKRG